MFLAGYFSRCASEPISTGLRRYFEGVPNFARSGLFGLPIPILYLGTSQINVQLPWSAQLGSTQLEIVTKSARSAVTVELRPQCPGIFVAGDQAIAQNPDGSLNGSEKAAAAGDFLVVYFTGGGPVTNQSPIRTGDATPLEAFRLLAPASATLGGRAAAIEFAGMAPGLVGTYQLNLRIPTGLKAGPNRLRLRVGNQLSNAGVVYVR